MSGMLSYDSRKYNKFGTSGLDSSHARDFNCLTIAACLYKEYR